MLSLESEYEELEKVDERLTARGLALALPAVARVGRAEADRSDLMRFIRDSYVSSKDG